MKDLKITKLETLAKKDIKDLVIHSTRSSLRRAAAVKTMISEPGTDNVPPLSYIVESVDEENNATCSVHALASDLTRYLLTKGASA